MTNDEKKNLKVQKIIKFLFESTSFSTLTNTFGRIEGKFAFNIKCLCL
jgi:hypothetical protein